MRREIFNLPLIYDPMVAKAELGNTSQGRILSDSVLRHYLILMLRDNPRGSLIHDHVLWVINSFPDIKKARRILPAPTLGMI